MRSSERRGRGATGIPIQTGHVSVGGGGVRARVRARARGRSPHQFRKMSLRNLLRVGASLRRVNTVLAFMTSRVHKGAPSTVHIHTATSHTPAGPRNDPCHTRIVNGGTSLGTLASTGASTTYVVTVGGGTHCRLGPLSSSRHIRQVNRSSQPPRAMLSATI